MLQKKKPDAFKAVIHLTDLDMGIFQGFLFSFGVKQEKFVLQNSLAEAQWKNLLLHPGDFNYSQIVVSPSLGQQVAKWWLSWTKMHSKTLQLHSSS